MTTQATSWQSESVRIGQQSEQPTSGNGGVVITCEFNASRPEALLNTRPLASLLADYEADQHRGALLAAARQSVATSLYAEGDVGLSKLRLAAGLSQGQLAAKVQTSQSHIARIELGRTDPGTDLVARVAEALGLLATDVFEAVRHSLKKANP